MKIDLAGRINNLHLPTYKGINSLHEAVHNSIDAIHERQGEFEGKIEVILEREGELDLESDRINPVKHIVIRDNGVGFHEDNYDSFQTADSTYKLEDGGKGIGRFLWLKVFENVEVESVFKSDDNFYERTFSFSRNGIKKEKKVELENYQDETYSVIRLKNIFDNYQYKLPKKLSTFAEKIVFNALPYFILDTAPVIEIKDSQNSIIVNDQFSDSYEYLVQNKSLEDDSNLSVIKYHTTEDSSHKLVLAAHKREVSTTNIQDQIPNLTGRLKDESGDEFITISVLEGKYLDENVSEERISFVGEQLGQQQLFNQGIAKLRLKAVDEIEILLSDYLEKIEERKVEKIKKYTEEKAPQYRHLLKYQDDNGSFDKIEPDISEEELDIQLYKLNQEFELETKREARKIISSEDYNFDDLKDSQRELFNKVNDISKSNLAKHIINRKLIIELLEKRLRIGEDDKYDLEESVHEIFFPLRSDTTEISYKDHNLWLIDEKLSYHHLIGSDKPLKDYENLDVDDEDRPDLLTFNKAMSFSDQEGEYSSVVIVEFKRPMRERYDSGNPISQVLDYVEKIRQNEATDKHGRPIKTLETTPFYAYIICDVNNQIKSIAKSYGMTKTPDQEGYFDYNKNYNTYYEIISFDKILKDASKRNRVLFDKLNILD